MNANRKSDNSIINAFFRPHFPQDANQRFIMSRLLRLVWPAFVEHALLQLVAMFDKMQVAGLGEAALVATGLAGQIRAIFVTVFVAINIGLTAVVAQAEGRKSRDEIPILIQHGLIITFIIAAIVAVIVYIWADVLLVAFNIPDDTSLRLGTEYFRIIMIGLIPLALTTTLTAALRGIGNLKIPMMYNLVANLINVLLNWILINGKFGIPRLEVRGAAFATVIGQVVAFLIACFVCFRPKNRFGLHLSTMVGKYKKENFQRLLSIGLPAAFESSISKFGTALYTSIVASLGTTLYATHVICIDIQLFTGMSGMAFSAAATTLSGQSIGAGRKDLAVLYGNAASKMCLSFSIILMAVYFFLGGWMISWYNSDPAIVSAGIAPLRIVAFMQPFAAFQYVFAGTMRGAGDTKSVAICYTFVQLFCRPFFAYIAIRFLGFGLNGAWWALASGETICSILLCLRYASGKWLYIMEHKRGKTS